MLSGFLLGVISAGIGMWAVTTRRAARRRIRAATRDAVHVELAVKALEQEEIRVRREVAEGLHGTLQSKLVLVDARLGDVLDHADRLDAADAESLAWVRAELDEAREIDVREMSRLLYPDRLELGLVPAAAGAAGPPPREHRDPAHGERRGPGGRRPRRRHARRSASGCSRSAWSRRP